VVRSRTDTADFGCDAGHLLHRSALTEPFKAPELDNLKVGIGHLPVIVEEDVDLAMSFKPGDWRYAYCPGHDDSSDGLSWTARFKNAEGKVNR